MALALLGPDSIVVLVLNEVADIVETIPAEDIPLSGVHNKLAKDSVPFNVGNRTGVFRGSL